MRFLSIATTLFLAATALAAGQNPVGCAGECSPSSDIKCKAPTPAVGRVSPGCFKCCESV